MKKKLNQAWKELEAVKMEITTYIEAQPGEQLNKTPGPNRWSVLQITAHITFSENKGLDYMKKKIQAGSNLPKSSVASAFRAWLLCFFLKLPIRFKAPLVLDTPDPLYDKDSLIQQWNKQRNELAEFLNQLPPELMDRDFFKHPIAGRMNIVQALRFMRTHAQRHYIQIKQIIDSEN